MKNKIMCLIIVLCIKIMGSEQNKLLSIELMDTEILSESNTLAACIMLTKYSNTQMENEKISIQKTLGFLSYEIVTLYNKEVENICTETYRFNKKTLSYYHSPKLENPPKYTMVACKPISCIQSDNYINTVLSYQWNISKTHNIKLSDKEWPTWIVFPEENIFLSLPKKSTIFDYINKNQPCILTVRSQQNLQEKTIIIDSYKRQNINHKLHKIYDCFKTNLELLRESIGLVIRMSSHSEKIKIGMILIMIPLCYHFYYLYTE